MPKSVDLLNHIGGNKTGLSPFFYKPTESPRALNVEFASELGGFKKADGYTAFLDDVGGTATQGLFPIEFPNGNAKLFQAVGGTIYEAGPSTWTSRLTGLNSANRFDSAVLYDRLYLVDGANLIQYTDDGLTWSTVTTYQPKFLETFRNRLYAANFDTDTANRFRFSDLGDGTTFSSSNYVDTIEQPITGMRATLNYMFFATREALWRWDETYLYKIDSIGTRAFRSMQFGAGLLFFANKDGVWASDGRKPQPISRPVQDWIDAISPTNLPLLNAVFFEDEYYLWIGDALGQSDVVLVYNSTYKIWRILTNVPSACMATWTNVNDDDNLYFGQRNDSVVYKIGGTVDQAGSTTTASYDYPPLGDGTHEVQGKSLYCFARSDGLATFQIQYALNWQDDFLTLKEWTLAGEGFTETIKIDVPMSLCGKTVQWRIVEATSGIPWTWEGMRFYYEPIPGVGE